MSHEKYDKTKAMNSEGKSVSSDSNFDSKTSMETSTRTDHTWSHWSLSPTGSRSSERTHKNSGSEGERVLELTDTGVGSTDAIPQEKDAAESPQFSDVQSKVSISSRSKKKDSHSTKIKPKKPKDFRPLTICLSSCRYEIVRTIAQKFGLVEVGEDEAMSCSIYWTDNSVSLEQVMNRRRFQLINHFPGMDEICHKDLLSRNLNRMKSLFPLEYDIFPKTWHLPADLGLLKAQDQKTVTYICKPDVGCQGQGIFLLRNIKDFNPLGPKMICQLYIAKPFLIDSFKFDLRIYVLVTSVDPLRIYVHKEGLARFATEKYRQPTGTNAQNSYMHLTNYSVNKHSQNFVASDDDEEASDGKKGESKRGSKRKLSSICKWLESRSYNTKKVLQNIDDVIIKTIISAHPTLKHYYRICYMPHDLFATSACFEILGFDILLDHKLKPYILEVNHSPSFHTDTKVDEDVKTTLLKDTFTMLNLKRRRLFRGKVEDLERKMMEKRLHPKKPSASSISSATPKAKGKETIGGAVRLQHQEQFEYEVGHSGSYRLIYPSADKKDKYGVFFEQSRASLYHELGTIHVKSTRSRKSAAAPSKLKTINKQKPKAINSTSSVKSGVSKVSGINSSVSQHFGKPQPSTAGPSQVSLGKITSGENNTTKAKPKRRASEKPKDKDKVKIKTHKTSHPKTKIHGHSKPKKDDSRSVSPPSSASSKVKTTPKSKKEAAGTLKIENLVKKKRKSTSSSSTSTSKSESTDSNSQTNKRARKVKKKKKSPPKDHPEEQEGNLKGGTVIRDLGIDLEVLKVFKSIGSLKPEDEKSFRAKHGFFKTTISTQNSRPDSNTTISGSRTPSEIELGTTRPVSKNQRTQDQNP